MAPSFLASVPLLLFGLNTVSAIYPAGELECKPDSCLQGLGDPRFKASALAFCATYVTIVEANPLRLPIVDTNSLSEPIVETDSPSLNYLENCELKPSAVSSACSCLIASQTAEWGLPSQTPNAPDSAPYPYPTATYPSETPPTDSYPMETPPTEEYPTETIATEPYPTETIATETYLTETTPTETYPSERPTSTDSGNATYKPPTYGYSNSSATSTDSGNVTYKPTSPAYSNSSATSTDSGSVTYQPSAPGYSSSTSTSTGPETVSTQKPTMYGYSNSTVGTTTYSGPATIQTSASIESSTPYPITYRSGNETTRKPTTYGYSTSTIRTTSYETIISCHPTVTDCPARSSSYVVTHTIDVSTTICPITSYPAQETNPVPTSYVKPPTFSVPGYVSVSPPVQTYTVQPLYPSGLITAPTPVGTAASSNRGYTAPAQPSYPATNTPREVGSSAGMVSAQWSVVVFSAFVALVIL